MHRIALAALLLFGAQASAEPFTFVALGDMPYGEPAEVYPPYEALIAKVNDTAPALVLHIGDIKSGGTPCTDEMFADQLAFMNEIEAPVLYTPGDNEWTDCHRENAGGFDPLERLDRLRADFFAEPGKTLGANPADVTSQADAGYPENARMMLNDVMFVTAHVVGSNNNFEIRDPDAVDEFFARDAAAIDWLKASFAAATGENAGAVVLGIHADMFSSWTGFAVGEGWPRQSGFANFGPAVAEAAAEFGEPVLLIYGDSHVFDQSRPFPVEAPNLLALQVPGADAMHAVEITADPEMPGAFAIALLMNPALSN